MAEAMADQLEGEQEAKLWPEAAPGPPARVLP